jgi:hypothetical protein
MNQGIPVIVALAPDYRARVKSVQLSGTGVIVEIETPYADEDDILGKVYQEDQQGTPRHFDRSFQNGTASLAITSYPRRMLIALISRTGGDLIDEWSYDSVAPFNAGVELESTE